jgi:hypothetical protein
MVKVVIFHDLYNQGRSLVQCQLGHQLDRHNAIQKEHKWPQETNAEICSDLHTQLFTATLGASRDCSE